MKRKIKKGFTLIELLAVIIIIGILSGLSIAAYSKYVVQAKKEKDRLNKDLIVNAAKSYLENNSNLRPKEIGESIKIGLRELKNANFLKENVTNSKGESCMDKSYVYVHKNSYGKYTYEGVLNCGDNEQQDINNVAKPIVKDFSFKNSNDVKNASFSMTLYGSIDNTIEIEGYSYTITFISGGLNKNTNTYNSKTISGAGHKKIVLKNIKISDLIDVTDNSKIKVNVTVKNVLGGVFEFEKTLEFEDKEKPKCGTITGEATGEDDWINKKEKRTITVGCSDGNGSGCVRDVFSKTWPREQIKTIEEDIITIKDNSKKENSENCRVRVNFDGVGPTINVKLNNSENQETLNVTAIDGEKKTIKNTDYNDDVNGWLNGIKYKNKTTYKISVSDDIDLVRYTWETGKNDSKSGTFTHSNNQRLKNTTFEVDLVDEGTRTGTLTVYDKAGNSTVVVINAKIDRTAPTIPTVSGYKKKSSADISSSKGLDSYTFNTWYNGFVYTEATASADSLSGMDGYYCTSKGQTEDITNSKQSIRNVNIEGKVIIKYKACDIAGNCTKDVENIVLLDRSAPEIVCNITKSEGITITRKTDNNGSGVDEESLKYVASMAETKEGIQAPWQTTNEEVIEKLNSKTTCGENPFKGYVSVADILGNSEKYKCSNEVEQPTCCSSVTYKNGTTCSKKCGGGTYNRIAYSSYDGSRCKSKDTSSGGSACNTQTCCSESNPFGCRWTTACRSEGTTRIYTSSSLNAEAGYVRHNDDGYDDKLYILTDSKEIVSASGVTWIRVCAETGYFYTGADWIDWGPLTYTDESTGRSCYKVWIAKNCTGKYLNVLDQSCPRTACPG